ncbi:MAG: hypothetical protein HY703_08970 [Gemmatimonadetes bacterium]|nr:hypothetical protein [Gemmatimonadota bacterium]
MGLYGRFYYPVYALSFGLLREDDRSPRAPVHSGFLGLSYDRLLNHGFTAYLNAEGTGRIGAVSDYRFLKLDVGFTKLLRLAPRLVLVPAVRAGAGWELPEVKRYELEDVMRGSALSGEGDVVGNLSVDLVFPITFGRKRNLLNLAVFRGLAGSVFLEAGDVWDRNAEVLRAETLLDDVKVNGGVELSVLFTTFFDIRLPMSFGYGHNLWSAREGGMRDTGRFYVRLDTPVTLFAVARGY